MESTLTRAAAGFARPLRRVDRAAASTWALVGGLIIYLGFSGGGYDFIVSSQVGLILWWIVLIGAAVGILPVARLSRTGWTRLGVFSLFVTWTALGATWSISSDRSLQDLARLAKECRRLGIGSLWLAYHGTASPDEMGVHARMLPRHGPVTGWVAISMFKLKVGEYGDPDAYSWLETMPLKEYVGQSIRLYYVAQGAGVP